MDIGQIAQAIHNILSDPTLQGIGTIASLIGSAAALCSKQQSSQQKNHHSSSNRKNTMFETIKCNLLTHTSACQAKAEAKKNPVSGIGISKVSFNHFSLSY